VVRHILVQDFWIVFDPCKHTRQRSIADSADARKTSQEFLAMAAARHAKLAMGLNKNALQSTALAHKLGQACMDERSTPLINIDSYGML